MPLPRYQVHFNNPGNCTDESESDDSFNSDSDSFCSEFSNNQEGFSCDLVPVISKRASGLDTNQECSCSFAKSVKSDIKKNICPKCRIQCLSGSNRSLSKPILKENQPKKCCSQRMSKPSSVKFNLEDKGFPPQSFDDGFCSQKESSPNKCEEKRSLCEDKRSDMERELPDLCNNEDYTWSPRKRWSSEDIFALCKFLSREKSDNGLNAKLRKIITERASCDNDVCSDAFPGRTAASRIRSSVGNLPLHSTSEREKFLLKSSCAPLQQQYMASQAFRPVMRRRSASQAYDPEDKTEFFIPFASPKDKSILKSFPEDKCQFKFKMGPPQSCTAKIPLEKRCSKKFKFRFPFELRCTNSRCPKHVQEKQSKCEFKSDDKCEDKCEKKQKSAKPKKSKSGRISKALSQSEEKPAQCPKNPSDLSLSALSICSPAPQRGTAPPCPSLYSLPPPPPVTCVTSPQCDPDRSILVCTPCSLSQPPPCLPTTNAVATCPPTKPKNKQACYEVKRLTPPRQCALDLTPTRNPCKRKCKKGFAPCPPIRIVETPPTVVSSTLCCTLCGSPSKSVASSKTICSCIQLSHRRQKCDQCDRGCNILTALLHSFILLLLAAATVLILVYAFIICRKPGVGFGKDASNNELINLHSILMLIGLVTLVGFAMIVYRLGQSCQHGYMKFLHFIFHSLAIPFVVLGFYAAYDSHSKDQAKFGQSFNSLHSWAGLIALGMFFFQFFVAFVSFVLLNCCDTLTSGFRNALIPIHSALGIITFMLAIMASLTGLTQKVLKEVVDFSEDLSLYYIANNEEFESRMFTNAIGTILILLAILMPLSLTRRNEDGQIIACVERC